MLKWVIWFVVLNMNLVSCLASLVLFIFVGFINNIEVIGFLVWAKVVLIVERMFMICLIVFFCLKILLLKCVSRVFGFIGSFGLIINCGILVFLLNWVIILEW